MYLESPLVKDSKPQFEVVMYDCIQVLFGTNPQNLNSAIWDSLHLAITDTFIDATIQDVQNAFRYAQIERKQYTLLTRDEILQPIKEYFFNKGIVTSKIRLSEQKQEEEIESERREKEYIEECKQLYLKSYKDSMMYLNENQATTLCKLGIFSQYSNDALRKQLVQQSEQEHLQRTQQQDREIELEMKRGDAVKIKELIPSAYRICGRMFIEHCLNHGYKFVQK